MYRLDDYIIAVNTGLIEPIDEFDRFLLENENLYKYDVNEFEEEPYGIIYLVINIINNKKYIGLTTRNFKERYNGNLLKGTHNEYLKNSIKKYGIENFRIIEVFDICYSKEHLDFIEDFWIMQFKTIKRKNGYNIRRGGHRGKQSNETKLKIGLKGEDNPFYGKHHTEEMCKYFSESQKRGKSKCAKKVICLEIKQVFDCLKDAADWLNLTRTDVLTKHLKGINKTVGKRTTGKEWHFLYYEDYLKQE